jgi:thiol-disulfide isomerase/thioredoxin
VREIRVGGLVLVSLVACAACASGEAPTGTGDADGSGGKPGGGGAGAEAGANAGGAGGSGAIGGGSACEYPQGEPGVLEGMLVDGALAWQGYAAASDAPSTVAAADYFDCDGAKGIDALLVIQSATWCGPCQAEAATLEAKMQSSWTALGIEVLTLMVEDGNTAPATIDTAAQWRSAFELDSVAVAADPDFTFRYFDFDKHIDEAVFPTKLVIDPRTMTITVRDVSNGDVGPALEALAAANQ